MTEAQYHFIKRAVLLTITIIIYIVLTSTIIDYRQERKVTEILYGSVKSWTGKSEPVDPSRSVIDREKALVTTVDEALAAKLAGRILLQIEENGEGWYVFPDDRKKYYLGRPDDALKIIQALGLGVEQAELDRYLRAKFPARLAGKILLDVTRAGEAYYVNPLDFKGYALGRPADALLAMKQFGLGVTNADLHKIAVGEIF
ncbi:MAG: hypothetical protein MUC28_00595 [Planctomycetes bacterium]|jgi:hypothetical protein|nr:hypothetical protein [Planctomycetota bacterium]